jgi:hypothetical protein
MKDKKSSRNTKGICATQKPESKIDRKSWQGTKKSPKLLMKHRRKQKLLHPN